MSFSKIHAKKKSVYVIEQIIGSIKNEELKVGSKIPPERVLADEMGVSRTSVREALTALQTVGIIEVESGKGAYVKSSTENRDLIQPFLVLNEDMDLLYALEAREVMERGISELAIDKGTPEDIQEIGAALSKMRKALQNKNYDLYSEADFSFHLAIAEASHNPFVMKALHSFIEATRDAFWERTKKAYYTTNENHIEKSLNYHRQIFEGIQDGDKAALSEGLKAHFKGIKRILTKVSDELQTS